MCIQEAQQALQTQNLPPPTLGSNSRKYVSESLDKVLQFQNNAPECKEACQVVLRFELNTTKYLAIRNSTIPQFKAQGSPSVVFNTEGVRGGDLNLGVSSSQLGNFNSTVNRVTVVAISSPTRE
jgi:hypothetical protein